MSRVEESPHFYWSWLLSCPPWLSKNQNKCLLAHFYRFRCHNPLITYLLTFGEATTATDLLHPLEKILFLKSSSLLNNFLSYIPKQSNDQDKESFLSISLLSFEITCLSYVYHEEIRYFRNLVMILLLIRKIEIVCKRRVLHGKSKPWIFDNFCVLSLILSGLMFSGGVFSKKWSLSFLNFLSIEDHSILYESWDVQLTFDALINAFSKLDEFRKMSTISSIFIKTFWTFLWWKIWQIDFFFHLIIIFMNIFVFQLLRVNGPSVRLK